MQQLAAAPAPTQCALMSQESTREALTAGASSDGRDCYTRQRVSSALRSLPDMGHRRALTAPQGLEALPASQLLHVPPSLPRTPF